MAEMSAVPVHAHHPPTAVMISSGSHPSTLEELNTYHKDPMYELVTGARDAYHIQKLAHQLGTRITRSEDIKNIASLVGNASSELERNWRMAACIANAPVSTGYPYLPMMPASSQAASSATDGAESAGSSAPAAAAVSVAKASVPLSLILYASRLHGRTDLTRLAEFI